MASSSLGKGLLRPVLPQYITATFSKLNPIQSILKPLLPSFKSDMVSKNTNENVGADRSLSFNLAIHDISTDSIIGDNFNEIGEGLECKKKKRRAPKVGNLNFKWRRNAAIKGKLSCTHTNKTPFSKFIISKLQFVIHVFFECLYRSQCMCITESTFKQYKNGPSYQTYLQVDV